MQADENLDLHDPNVSTARAVLEFSGLLGAALVAYAIQETVSERAGQVLAVPLYLAFAIYFWLRGRYLAIAEGRMVALLLGPKAGTASARWAASTLRLMGILGLLLIPLAAVSYAATTLP